MKTVTVAAETSTESIRQEGRINFCLKGKYGYRDERVLLERDSRHSKENIVIAQTLCFHENLSGKRLFIQLPLFFQNTLIDKNQD